MYYASGFLNFFNYRWIIFNVDCGNVKAYNWPTSTSLLWSLSASVWRFRPRLDNCVGNESLETLFWLKWGFVIMIIGYIYSQKCNENAKLNWVIIFWILVAFFQNINKKNSSRVQNISTFSFWHFHYTFDYKYREWS